MIISRAEKYHNLGEYINVLFKMFATAGANFMTFQELNNCLKTFIPHAASLRQAFAHCAIFPTAASRRSLGRVSVPVWPVALSGRLPVVALVSHYLTNKLIGRESILNRKTFQNHVMPQVYVSGISPGFPGLFRN